MTPRLILGSASPRRLDLLAGLGLTPDDVRPAEIDESPLEGELPRDYCRRVTCGKLRAVRRNVGEVVLAADTTVAVGRRILGKPASATEARRYLALLSGRRHRVITVVGVLDDTRERMREVVTQVRMARLTDHDIADYIATGDWQGKAGGYAIQGPAGQFISKISGSYTGVMGLPVHETARLLASAGIRAPL
ncbi:MAG: Maf family protein [Pseudomonadota bacterium]